MFHSLFKVRFFRILFFVCSCVCLKGFDGIHPPSECHLNPFDVYSTFLFVRLVNRKSTVESCFAYSVVPIHLGSISQSRFSENSVNPEIGETLSFTFQKER